MFVFPDDHQRTRLTHALEVAQVATAIARAAAASTSPLTEAIALGHDCGHGPGGHASEDALRPYVDGGYDHAVWGADVVLAPLNLCAETLDGIRNHSWSRPAPATPEGEVVSAGPTASPTCATTSRTPWPPASSRPAMLPAWSRERCGTDAARAARRVHRRRGRRPPRPPVASACAEPMAEALAAFRRFNYERIYLRPASVEQADAVIAAAAGARRALRRPARAACRADRSTPSDAAGSADGAAAPRSPTWAA